MFDRILQFCNFVRCFECIGNEPDDQGEVLALVVGGQENRVSIPWTTRRLLSRGRFSPRSHANQLDRRMRALTSCLEGNKRQHWIPLRRKILLPKVVLHSFSFQSTMKPAWVARGRGLYKPADARPSPSSPMPLPPLAALNGPFSRPLMVQSGTHGPSLVVGAPPRSIFPHPAFGPPVITQWLSPYRAAGLLVEFIRSDHSRALGIVEGPFDRCVSDRARSVPQNQLGLSDV